MAYKNGPEISLKLGAAVTLLHALLKIDSNGEAIVTTGVDAADMPVAVAMEKGVEDQVIKCRMIYGGTFPAVASGIIAIGSTVYSAADGKVTTTVTSSAPIGKALQAAGADGDIIEIIPAAISPELGSLPLTGGTLSGNLTFADAVNIVVNATTGTKIGTATTQKLGFWNAAPVVQPAHANQAAIAALTSATLTDNGGGAAADGTIAVITNAANAGSADVGPTADAIKECSDQINKLIADVTAIRTFAAQLRSDLVTIGIIKGAA